MALAMSLIHPMSQVSEDCRIAAGTRVMQFASVVRRSNIGQDCVISPGAVVDASYVGDECKIGPGAFVSPGSVLCACVFVGPGAVLCNDAWPRTHTRGFQIDTLLGQSVTTIFVHQGASIGARAVVMPGITIGKRAMVAAGAVVTECVPDECLWTREGEVRAISGEERKTRVRFT